MDEIKNGLSLFFGVLKSKKKDIFKSFFVFALCLVVFTLMQFPFADLNDFLTKQIYQNSNRMVYAQFENIDIGLFPFPSFEAQKVTINSKGMPSIKANKMLLSPSPIDLVNILVKHAPSLSKVELDGFLNASIEGSLNYEGNTEDGSPKHKIQLEAQSLSLSDLQPFLSLPFSLGGSVDARIEALVTFDLSEQPDGDIELSSKDITLPSITIPTAIGAVTLPTLKFSKLNLKGRMNDSRLYIEELELGGPSDPLQLKVKGDSGFYFKQGRGASPVVVENFKIKIQLDVSSEMQSSLYFISLLDEFKKNGTQGNSRYLFRVSGRNLQNPDISDLSSF